MVTLLTGFVYGSEFKKGTSGAEGSITPGFTTYANSPIIIKDRFAVDGSDASQLGWVEVADESGTSGYLWYLKAEGETRLRFEDYLEMSVVEAQKASAAADGATRLTLLTQASKEQKVCSLLLKTEVT